MNPPASSNVYKFVEDTGDRRDLRISREVRVSLLKRLFGQNDPPKPRVRICVECGMPIAEHKNWCSILRRQNEMKLRSENTSEA